MDKCDYYKYREYHWSYFSMHGDQRLKTFNFYLIASAIFIGGFVNMIKDGDEVLLGFILPYILSFISFIFWKLDVRTKRMIKISENAIKKIDDLLIDSVDDSIRNELNIFRHDDFLVEKLKSSKSVLVNHMSYSKCFNAIFLMMGLLGFVIGTIFLINCIC